MVLLRVMALSMSISLVAGCGESRKTAIVSGRVTLNGKLVQRGAVVFMAEDGSYSESARIRASGDYRANKAPLGQAKVAIVIPESPGADATPREVPESIGNPETSGIQFDVMEGENSFDITLPVQK